MSYTDTTFESFFGALQEVIQYIKGQGGCEAMDSFVDFRIVEIAPDGMVQGVFSLDSETINKASELDEQNKH